MCVLEDWTTEVPFYDHYSNTYIQYNGTAMGSALRPSFRNFNMVYRENIFFNYIQKLIYIMSMISSLSSIKQMDYKIYNCLSKKKKILYLISFMDWTLIISSDFLMSWSREITIHHFRIQKNPIGTKSCTVNYKSESPKPYKITIIKTLIHRARVISSF